MSAAAGNNGAIPPEVRQALQEWASARGVTLDVLKGIGCRCARHPRHGFVLVWPYQFADGSSATRMLALELQGGPDWRNEGPIKGAAMALGDTTSAVTVVVAEGESDGLAAFVRRPSDVAVIVVPGSGMVADDIANFIGNSARVVIATDADEAGDKCAESIAAALVGAGVDADLVRRLRPVVEGVEAPDLRDLLERLDFATDDPEAEFLRLLAAAPEYPCAKSAESAESAESPSQDTPSAWSAPISLDGPAPPAFPVRALGALAPWARAVGGSYQTPVDLPAVMALGAISAAVAGRARVRVSADWSEALCAYCAAVLPSGERKSPVVREVVAPIERWEAERREQAAMEMALFEDRRKMAQKRLDRAIAEAAAATGPDRFAREAEAEGLRIELANMRPPASARILADDATPEALVSLMARHGGRMAVISDEGGVLDILAGRYSSNVPNLDAVLKAWGGDPIRVDRKGRESELIPRSALTLALAVQPSVLSSLAQRTDAMRGRGLLARFWFVVPRTALGHRDNRPAPVEGLIRADFHARIGGLLTGAAKSAEPAQSPFEEGSAGFADSAAGVEITLSAEAASALDDFRDEIEPRLDPLDGDLFGAADWVGKLAGGAVRIAALLHLYGLGWDEGTAAPIPGETMVDAIEIGGALIPHALAALGLTGPRAADVGPARAVLRWIRREEIEEVSVRDALTALSRSTFPDARSVERALGLLESMGYVRRLPDPERSPGQPGRPSSPRYEVNPATLVGRGHRDGGGES